MQPVKNFNNREEQDSNECPFIRQRVCNTKLCPGAAGDDGGDGGASAGNAGGAGLLAVAVRVFLPSETLATMGGSKQRYLMDSVEATLDAAIRDPALFEVQLPAGVDSDKFATECEVQLASVEVKRKDSLGAESARAAVPCADADDVYPCDLKASNLRRPGVDLLLQVFVANPDEAKAIISIISTSTFPRDVSLMAQQSSKKLNGMLQFSPPKVVHVVKAERSKSGGLSSTISRHVHYARTMVGRMKAHHWALVIGILLGISAFFTIYKVTINY
jgi:hypothetical protein